MPVKQLKRKTAKKKPISESFDRYKFSGSKQYTGMKVGGSHKWYYDKGVWKDKKITPDLWEINYAVTKRRAGKAPKDRAQRSAPATTGISWLIKTY